MLKTTMAREAVGRAIARAEHAARKAERATRKGRPVKAAKWAERAREALRVAAKAARYLAPSHY